MSPRALTPTPRSSRGLALSRKREREPAEVVAPTRSPRRVGNGEAASQPIATNVRFVTRALKVCADNVSASRRLPVLDRECAAGSFPMSDDDTYLRLLRGKADQLAGKSPGIESMPAREAATLDPAAPPAGHSDSASLEAIIRWYRPVLAVADDHFVRSVANPDGSERFPDPNQEASKKALLDALEQIGSMLDPAIRSVGRIELVNNAQYPWVGTGWIIDSELGSDIIVTNGHVAEKFGKRSGAGLLFQPGIPDFSVKQSARPRLPRGDGQRSGARVSDHRHHLDLRHSRHRYGDFASSPDGGDRSHRSADPAASRRNLAQPHACGDRLPRLQRRL